MEFTNNLQPNRPYMTGGQNDANYEV
jgi:hypothetical protein